MCGIAGILGPDVALGQLQNMVTAQRHRGPDDMGMEMLPTGSPGVGLALGHTRLAILDLSPAGHQPMRDPGSDRRVVYNGEIYNHLAIRKELGVEFRSTCDTETLLAAYGRWGRDCVERFRGMFAFAIWDPIEQELFLCRDRLGVKPLYYAKTGSRFLFASELRAILESGLVPRKLDRDGLDGYLAFGTVPEPLTIIKDIRLLPAGCWMRVSPVDGIREIRRYWSPPYSTSSSSTGTDSRSRDLQGEFRSIFDEAVECRLLSDVPLAVFLSGGIDSSAIVAALAQANHRSVRTLTLHFTERGYGEGPFAEQVAARFKTDHQTQPITSDDLLSGFDDALAACDQPSIDGVNTYTVCRLAREAGLTVALCGHGGDELFGGYDNFRLIPRVLGFAAVPRPLRRLMGRTLQTLAPARVSTQKAASLLLSPVDVYETYALARGVFWDDVRSRLLDRPEEMIPAARHIESAVPPGELADDPLNQVSQLELGFYLRNSLLRDTDVYSMVHGLEVRLPLLDHRLVEFAAPLSGRSKMAPGSPKRLLVQAMGSDLPAEVVRRRKQGFVIPYEVWMRGSLKPQLDQTLRDSDVAGGLGLRPDRVRGVWSDFLEGSRRINMQHPFALYVLLSWCSRHGVAL
ncbi:asparagine synthase (glutamine-hydrolyzing) [Planctomyces sp. SH-PL62]|uniref:asparagine synthase (glutamine-hydrolyzing) n=1 Tax=Planctomyces sp. SH-PL62 TaxID=1636152 RepID=UPI0008395F1C|nr:asparagine synthase (glutamine-hydrolyzing) [Planctomyces sp. SH-PL62]